MKVLHTDITTLESDAIVNAANSSLLGGGGVDGAIHKAAGPDLVHECRLLGGCKTGQAKITKGYNLKAKFIIHTVGPVWNHGRKNETKLLESCYQNALELCIKHHIKSVAFPCISTGIYKFPKDYAATIAVKTCKSYIRDHDLDITFCCFEETDIHFYTNIL